MTTALRPDDHGAGRVNTPELRHLNQTQLARRWSISPRTLERWRWQRKGPPYLKVEGRVLYRVEDVEEFEKQRMHGHE